MNRLFISGLIFTLLIVVAFGPSTASDNSGSRLLKESVSSSIPCIRAADTTMTSEAAPWPTPIITSLYPSSVIAGSHGFTLTVDGNYFIQETRVLWDARDYTTAYLSPYQMTAEIPAYELGTPGQHYVWVFNPDPCGGQSNITTFQIRNTGRSFEISTSPLEIQGIKGITAKAAIIVQNPPKGLLHYNITLTKDAGAPFSFAFSDFPSWVSSRQVTWLNPNQIQISGDDENDRITNNTGEAILVNLSIIGTKSGGGTLTCTLNEAIADDGTSYGTGYTALPVMIREIHPFPNLNGGNYPAPTDINDDGRYEDINGNRRLDFSDIVIYFNNTAFIIDTQPWWLFDYDQNRVINLNDVVTLFKETY